MKSRFFLICLIIVVLPACKTLDVRTQISKLDESLSQYGTALRWALIRDAASYHVRRNVEPVVVDLEHMQQFNITSVKILERTVNEEGTEASILIEINYYAKDRGTVQKVRQAQLWWYEPEIKHWLIDTEFPEFK